MSLPAWQELVFDLSRKVEAGTAPQRIYVTQDQWDELVDSWKSSRLPGYDFPNPFVPGKGMIYGIPIEVAR